MNLLRYIPKINFPLFVIRTKPLGNQYYANNCRLPRRKLSIVHVSNGDDRVVDSEEDNGLENR